MNKKNLLKFVVATVMSLLTFGCAMFENDTSPSPVAANIDVNCKGFECTLRTLRMATLDALSEQGWTVLNSSKNEIEARLDSSETKPTVKLYISGDSVRLTSTEKMVGGRNVDLPISKITALFDGIKNNVKKSKNS